MNIFYCHSLIPSPFWWKYKCTFSLDFITLWVLLTKSSPEPTFMYIQALKMHPTHKNPYCIFQELFKQPSSGFSVSSFPIPLHSSITKKHIWSCYCHDWKITGGSSYSVTQHSTKGLPWLALLPSFTPHVAFSIFPLYCSKSKHHTFSHLSIFEYIIPLLNVHL